MNNSFGFQRTVNEVKNNFPIAKSSSFAVMAFSAFANDLSDHVQRKLAADGGHKFSTSIN